MVVVRLELRAHQFFVVCALINFFGSPADRARVFVERMRSNSIFTQKSSKERDSVRIGFAAIKPVTGPSFFPSWKSKISASRCSRTDWGMFKSPLLKCRGSGTPERLLFQKFPSSAAFLPASQPVALEIGNFKYVYKNEVDLF